jgi:ABC-type transporter Mla subunit MlaD
MRYERSEIKVGSFVTLAALALSILLIWVSGYVPDVWDRPVRYYTRLQDAEGLDAGNTVYLAGIPAGVVKAVVYCPEGIPVPLFREMGLHHVEGEEAGGQEDFLRLDREAGLLRYEKAQDRSVLVVFTLGERYMEAILEDCMLVVQKEIFGAPSINISPGSKGSLLSPGGYVPGQPSVMARVIQELDLLEQRVSRVGDRLEQVLTNAVRLTREGSSLDRILTNVEEVSVNLVSITGQLEDDVAQLGDPAVIEDIRASTAHLHGLLERLDLSTQEHLSPTLARIASLTERAEALLAENQEVLGQVLSESHLALVDLRGFLQRLDGFLDRIEGALGSKEEGIIALSEEMRQLVQGADQLVEDLRQRVAEFRWSYLHYILFAPDAREEAQARLFDLARELTASQEEMLAAVLRIDALLEGSDRMDPALRAELEHSRAALQREIQKGEDIEKILLDALQERAGR